MRPLSKGKKRRRNGASRAVVRPALLIYPNGAEAQGGGRVFDPKSRFGAIFDFFSSARKFGEFSARSTLLKDETALNGRKSGGYDGEKGLGAAKKAQESAVRRTIMKKTASDNRQNRKRGGGILKIFCVRTSRDLIFASALGILSFYAVAVVRERRYKI